MGTIAELVTAAAQRRPDGRALVCEDRTLTWSQVDAAVDGAAAGLAGLGLGAGDRVALCVPDPIDFALSYFGVLRAGMVAVPIASTATGPDLAYLLTNSGAKVLVGESGSLGGDLPAVPTVEAAALLAETARWDGPLAAGGEDIAVLLYTSGTSGQPRAAMLSHRALTADLDHVSRIEPAVTVPDDIVLIAVPLHHVYGLNSGLGMVAQHAATAVLLQDWEPDTTLATVRSEHVSVIVAVPQMYLAWSMSPAIDEAFDSVRVAISGSAPLPPAVLRRVLDSTGRHIFEGYGLTETAPSIATTLMSEVPKPGSIGRPVPGVQVRLVEPTGRPDAREVDEDDTGEVTVRGSNLFSGYWPDGADGPDADGWWFTGDLAYADADGDLYLVDRRRELIMVSGFNVYPREVELALSNHPGVAEAAVIGIVHPYTGEAVKALIVPQPGVELTAAEIQAHAATQLSKFKCPTTVEFVEALPHTATGKVRKGSFGPFPTSRARAGERRRPPSMADRAQAPDAQAGAAPRVRVFTRDGCHLCDDALVIVQDVTNELDERFDVVDVDSDPDLVERYGDRVPVVLVDGSEHGFWRVEPDRLRLALRGRRGWLGRTSRGLR